MHLRVLESYPALFFFVALYLLLSAALMGLGAGLRLGLLLVAGLGLAEAIAWVDVRRERGALAWALALFGALVVPAVTWMAAAS